MRIIRAAECRSMPWKNGGGTTTEIAAHPPGASLDAFDWRISMAHVGTDGPFSSFPGIDRTLSVLTGNGIVLAFGDGEAVRLDRMSAPYPFAADRPVEGQLSDGPIDDLNVMTRRGRWSHEVQRLAPAGIHRLDPGGDVLMLIAHGGGWQLRDATSSEALASGDCALPQTPVHAEPDASGNGVLFAVRLRRSG